MISRRASPTLAAIFVGLSLSGCGKDEKSTAEAAGDEQAPVLNAEAGQAALTLISGDLNAPLAEVQAMLANAAGDRNIEPDELMLSTPEGSIPLDWWIWNHGFVRLASDPDYGPYLALSEKGDRFLKMDTATWLTPSLVGAPNMQCQAAGSATSAACSAVVTYATTVGQNADLGRITVPQASADLEAIFAPGRGWSVSRLSAEGDTPAVLVRTALFGSSESREASRAQYQTALRAALDRMDRSAASAAATPASAAPVREPEADRADTSSRASDSAAPPPAERSMPHRITNPTYARQPTADELMSVFPPRALQDQVTGRSTMTCTVTVGGQLTNCVSSGEAPAGYRFGQAGVAAAPFFRMHPRTDDGRAVESRVSLSINWNP